MTMRIINRESSSSPSTTTATTWRRLALPVCCLLTFLLGRLTTGLQRVEGLYDAVFLGNQQPTTTNAEELWQPKTTTTTPTTEKETSTPTLVVQETNNEEKNKKYSWPSTTVDKLGSPLVQVGNNFVDNAKDMLLAHWDEFWEVYQNRPDKVNLCGIRINHAYALWLTVKHLQPTTIVESGVNAGQSTYFMRNASSSTTCRIVAIDPMPKPICNQGKRWIDDNPHTEYLVGPKFLDFQAIDWESRIRAGQVDPSNTLVFLDDHLNSFQRFSTLMRFGFRHIMLEDNYRVREGATDGDKAGFTMKQMLRRVDADTEFLYHQLKSYAEFPPLFPSSMASQFTGPRKAAGGFLHRTDTNVDVVEPMFRPDVDPSDRELYQELCQRLGINHTLQDNDSYMQIMNYNMICYLELRPLAPLLAKNWKRT